MDPRKPITNPMLCGTIGLLKAEDTPEHRKLFMEELMKAHFLAPVIIDPPPKADEMGRVKFTAENKVQFPMLPTKDGVQFFMAFTDYDELKKWQAKEGQQTMAFTFNDYANLLFRKNKEGQTSPAMGFVINPFGENVVVTKQMVAKYMAMKMAGSGAKVPMPRDVQQVMPNAEAEGEAQPEEGSAE